MHSQIFTHPNELLAAAPLNSDGDHSLFAKQNVHVIDGDRVQWDFILHNGKDWHFRQEFMNLRDDARLDAYKNFIRHSLTKSLAVEI